jgi:hypothetical protein
MRKTLCLLFLVLVAAALISRTQAATATASCPATFPRVVATFEHTGSDSVPQTTIYRPTKDGLFRINNYMETTQATPGSACQWAVVEGWETGLEEPDARGLWGVSTPCDHITYTFNQSIVHDVAGSAIQVFVVPVLGDGSGTTYSLRVVLEQLM